MARLSGSLATVQQAADSARAREEEARATGRELAERARRAEALCAEYEADIGQVSSCLRLFECPCVVGFAHCRCCSDSMLSLPSLSMHHWCQHATTIPHPCHSSFACHLQLRATREGAAAHVGQLEDVVSQLRTELEARRQEVEQLTTLSLRGDATVQEYMSNLKVGWERPPAVLGHCKRNDSPHEAYIAVLDALEFARHARDTDTSTMPNPMVSSRSESGYFGPPLQAMSADLRAAEMRIADLISEVAAREDALARASAEAADLRRVVASLDGERDGLQVRIWCMYAMLCGRTGLAGVDEGWLWIRKAAAHKHDLTSCSAGRARLQG